VAGFLDSRNAELSGLAAIALGQSHLDRALDLLRARWDSEPLKRDAERVLLRAAALHRSEAALDWLLEVAAAGDRASAEVAIAELAAFGNKPRVREGLAAIRDQRGEPDRGR